MIKKISPDHNRDQRGENRDDDSGEGFEFHEKYLPFIYIMGGGAEHRSNGKCQKSPACRQAGMRMSNVNQIVFCKMDQATDNPYRGKYQGQRRSVRSRVFQDEEVGS